MMWNRAVNPNGVSVVNSHAEDIAVVGHAGVNAAGGSAGIIEGTGHDIVARSESEGDDVAFVGGERVRRVTQARSDLDLMDFC